jgi:transcriptional regulator with XRE-family HTH domain
VTQNLNQAKRPKLVGNFIRQQREKLHLSQRALGLLFDPPVTTQFISNVERGVTPLPPAHVPLLTKALQVSEAEIMSLLKSEYTFKLSGRLGIAQDDVGSANRPVIMMPKSASDQSNSSHIEVLAQDYPFIRALYQAYRGADMKTRETFSKLCETSLRFSLRTGTSATAAANKLNTRSSE